MKPAHVGRLFPELEVLDVVGHGGMGVVYKAQQKNLGREVALKLISSNLMDDPAFAERFTREARAMARMNHPNIIAIYDFGERENHHYLVMEYVDGLNLRQLVQGTKLAPAEALQMVPQLCDALQYAHDRGIVHRDIKPENVLVSQEGLIKIADFGLAKLSDGTPGNFTLTQSRQVMGTLNYMAPEQVETPTSVDHRADIYSLGVVIYELLTGELPLGRFSAPSERAEVDVRLDEVVMRALEKDPGLRYQQASEFKTGFQNVSDAGPFVKKFGGTRSEQQLAGKVACFVWTAVALTLCIGGGITIALGAIMDKEAQLWTPGFIAAGFGALLFALLAAFQSIFEGAVEPSQSKPKARLIRSILQCVAIPLILFAALSYHYQWGVGSPVLGICLAVGVVLLIIRSNINEEVPANAAASVKQTGPEVSNGTPLPNWLVALKIVSTACFFLCPLFFIASAFANGDDLQELLRFMGIASPITGAFMAAVVGTIASAKGYDDPDAKK